MWCVPPFRLALYRAYALPKVAASRVPDRCAAPPRTRQAGRIRSTEYGTERDTRWGLADELAEASAECPQRGAANLGADLGDRKVARRLSRVMARSMRRHHQVDCRGFRRKRRGSSAAGPDSIHAVRAECLDIERSASRGSRSGPVRAEDESDRRRFHAHTILRATDRQAVARRCAGYSRAVRAISGAEAGTRKKASGREHRRKSRFRVAT